MQLGIVSDTHDNLDLVDQAVQCFESEGVDRVIHCGDIVAPFSATPFDSDAFEFYAVRGNNDGEWAVQSTVESFGTYLGEAGALSFGGAGEGAGAGERTGAGGGGPVDVAVTHGTSGVVVDALVDCGDYDYVLHGHTHEYAHEQRDGTVRINPGGIPIDAAPENPYAVVLDTATGEIDRFELR